MKVRCIRDMGYPNLTEGKEYDVVELIPRLITTHFTFPRYVSVIGDFGKTCTGHAYRFETIEGVSMEDYIKENIKDQHDENF